MAMQCNIVTGMEKQSHQWFYFELRQIIKRALTFGHKKQGNNKHPYNPIARGICVAHEYKYVKENIAHLSSRNI